MQSQFHTPPIRINKKQHTHIIITRFDCFLNIFSYDLLCFCFCDIHIIMKQNVQNDFFVKRKFLFGLFKLHFRKPQFIIIFV